MSIRDQIPPLEELSAIDVDLRRIEEQLGKHRGQLAGMRSEVKSLEDRLKVDRESLSAMDKTRSELQIELRQMANQIERSREKLNRSRNERESMAAQREVEELRKLVRDREEELERLTGAADGARTSISDADGKLTDVSRALEGTAPGATESLATLEAEKAVRLEERAKVASKLPSTLYRRYESIRTRRPVAIARVTNGTCQGCHMSIPPMMFQQMRHMDEFKQCPSCIRIIYYHVPLETASSADPSRA
ncbi:zinc ribbon domain-containing protein [Chondromyces apiculatus]|uniref:zinc ribbon domain-containing protein n=1 Tax=Chondromyces apiculatus TaxID=51 RepID=UPI0005C446B9|nr:C4-type zinc ribbon domain-containing protein [Chondromyces apiculatus]